jgi:serine/threonine protein kinase
MRPEKKNVTTYNLHFTSSLFSNADDANHGLGWRIRYKIIKGICEGLKYLHMNLEAPIFHLNLKPANILLDKDLVPKIADFGLPVLHSSETIITSLESM